MYTWKSWNAHVILQLPICRCPWAKVKKWPWPSITSLIQLVVCIYQLSGHRLQWFLKNPLFSIFPIEMPKFPNLTLPLNRSWSTKGHHLNKLWWARVPNATYQVWWKSVHRFQRRRFLKGFYHIWAWWPSWSCDQHHVHVFSFPFTWKHTYKIWLKMAQ